MNTWDDWTGKLKEKESRMEEEWIALSQAAEKLSLSQPKLSRLVKKNLVSWKKSQYDQRVTLVEMNNVRQFLKSQGQLRGKAE